MTQQAAAPDTLRDPLIRAIQAGVPLVDAPFEELARALSSDEASVLEELGRLREEGVLREISAVLEGSALGYESALVAARVPKTDLERVVEIVNGHPTVSHNYLRDHDFNLWFTLAVPPEMGIEPTLEVLSRLTGVPAFHPLRRTTTFKIGVNFDPRTRRNQTAIAAARPVAEFTPEPRDVRCFRALQTPLPLVRRPFRQLAAGADVDEAELLAFAKRHLGSAIRRYVGTLRHRKLGVRANGMVVWRVPEADVEAVGLRLAESPDVSHCYARETAAGFPYSLYSMIHGPDEDACRSMAQQLSGQLGVDDYAVLFSTREFKKTRLRYFLPELDAWWTAHGPGAA